MTILRPIVAALFVTSSVPTVAIAQGTIAADRIFTAIGVEQGSTVCEIGAGDGELTIAAAKLVGAAGRVLTNELGDERVKTLRQKVAGSSLTQITVVAGGETATNFPDAGCDALFSRNVYHHFGNPAAMNAAMLAAVKPGGRLAVVDFTPPGKEAPKPTERANDGMHGVLPETVSRELREAGFDVISADVTQRAVFVVAAKPKR
jgi:ubiquinone/menaquinone biosynthesis C-methylase UbiE